MLVENFAAGVDTRKHPLSAPPGTLRRLANAHVTPGGEIEKRKAFVPVFFDTDDDTDKIQVDTTFGLAGFDGKVYVFQDNSTKTDTSGTWSSATTTFSGPYGSVTIERQLLTGASPAVNTLRSWDVYDGKLYVVASAGPTGTPQHFFDGARVTDVNAKGAVVKTFKEKIYALDGGDIRFCKPLDPTDWTTTADGAGFISASAQSGSANELIGMEIYFDRLAVFSRLGVQIWDMDADPANNTLTQTIRGIGIVGGLTPRQYGNGDVIFLSNTGIRSLRAKDSSNAGAVSDVGSPIDEEILRVIRTAFDTYASNSRTMIEEHTGRFWMSLGNAIWVLSAFPGPSVTAWSEYTPETISTTFEVEDLVEVRNLPFLRGTNDVIYVYGGTDGNTYDNTEATVELPSLTLERPANLKKIRGIDVTANGSWELDIRPNYNVEDWVLAAKTYGSTYLDGTVGAQAHTNALAVRLRSSEAKRTSLAQLIIHYDLARGD